jgi:hypothetical protein
VEPWMLCGAVPLASRPCSARRGRTMLRLSRPMASAAELHQDPPPVPAEMAAPYRDGCTSPNRASPQASSSCYPRSSELVTSSFDLEPPCTNRDRRSSPPCTNRVVVAC